MRIREIKEYQSDIGDAISKLSTQLVGKECKIGREQVEAIISDNNSHLFLALNDDRFVLGMVTVGIYTSPTGKKGWIEDVVVDEKYRGEGIGEKLTRFAIQFAKNQQADTLMLTSKPERIIANSLYKKLGFHLKETNVYRIFL